MFAGKFSYASEQIVFSMVFVVGIHICSFFLFFAYTDLSFYNQTFPYFSFFLFFSHVALIMSWGRAGSVGKMYTVALKNTARQNVLSYGILEKK